MTTLTTTTSRPPRFTAIDFETANCSRDSACEIGLAMYEGGELIAQTGIFLKPATRDFRFSWIHGITEAHVAHALDFQTSWPTIEAFFCETDYLVAHNVGFDRSVLEATARSFGVTLPPRAFVCTLKQARAQLKLPSYRLPDVAAHLGFAPRLHHAALEDALTAGAIHIALLARKDRPRELAWDARTRP